MEEGLLSISGKNGAELSLEKTVGITQAQNGQIGPSNQRKQDAQRFGRMKQLSITQGNYK